MRLKIWQQNLNKSDKAHFDLINLPVHKDWDLLLLQVLYIDKLGNTKATLKWHTVYPSSHLTDTSVTREVVLVNAAMDSNAWTQVPLEGSNDVVIIWFQLAQGQLFIFNIYNNCMHSDTTVPRPELSQPPCHRSGLNALVQRLTGTIHCGMRAGTSTFSQRGLPPLFSHCYPSRGL